MPDPPPLSRAHPPHGGRRPGSACPGHRRSAPAPGHGVAPPPARTCGPAPTGSTARAAPAPGRSPPHRHPASPRRSPPAAAFPAVAAAGYPLFRTAPHPAGPVPWRVVSGSADGPEQATGQMCGGVHSCRYDNRCSYFVPYGNGEREQHFVSVRHHAQQARRIRTSASPCDCPRRYRDGHPCSRQAGPRPYPPSP